jgi:hypothetical protein
MLGLPNKNLAAAVLEDLLAKSLRLLWHQPKPGKSAVDIQ